MPEIWIPYGDVEISVDIDSNNLSGIFKNEKTEFNDTILENNQILNNLNEKVIIFDICNSIGSISVIEMLIEIIKNSKRTNQIEIIIRKNHKKNIENLLKDKEFQHKVKSIEELSIDEITETINDVQVILLSNTSFDSLFGFNGGAISLARVLKDPIIKEAFYDKEIIYPESGIITNRSKIVQKEYEKYSNIISVQIIEDADGISNCLIGKLYDSYMENERHNLVAAYYKRLISDDENTRLQAAKAWSRWESSTSKLIPNEDSLHQFDDSKVAGVSVLNGVYSVTKAG